MNINIFTHNFDAVWPNEKYLVCRTTKYGDEIVVQSESTAERAERSVDILNEHERNNARRETYFWRDKASGEPSGRKYNGL